MNNSISGILLVWARPVWRVIFWKAEYYGKLWTYWTSLGDWMTRMRQLKVIFKLELWKEWKCAGLLVCKGMGWSLEYKKGMWNKLKKKEYNGIQMKYSVWRLWRGREGDSVREWERERERPTERKTQTERDWKRVGERQTETERHIERHRKRYIDWERQTDRDREIYTERERETQKDIERDA